MSTTPNEARRLVEIRAYRLRPGTRADFHAAVTTRALPMVRAYGMDVVSHGPVPNDENGYYLVRSFASLAELAAQEDGFYGSAGWRDGPREALVSRIETYLDTLLWLSPAAIADLRAGNAAPSVDA
jgi:hypothetical protein